MGRVGRKVNAASAERRGSSAEGKVHRNKLGHRETPQCSGCLGKFSFVRPARSATLRQDGVDIEKDIRPGDEGEKAEPPAALRNPLRVGIGREHPAHIVARCRTVSIAV